ncbi:hypothetical protein [Sphingomonas sp. Y38-1Y]|uniref:hypothetical protein n=1 Tax=Sphingomonas sp. Y38-1Y TaxID=3078265 RepID=UPI0028EDF534|nr:hypothetical protein [Sphingomonas sp. Y38-1Y]
MSEVDRLAVGPEACVTASELVRQFGLWQERALQQPVFVLRRGRPSLVLTSLDLMRRLCAPHEAAADTSLAALLLDAMRELVLVVDAGGRIEQLNRAARIAFGANLAGVGHPLSRPFNEAVARYLLDLAERTRRTGAPEQAEIAVRERRYRVVIVPYVDGALIVADDVSADDEGEALATRLAAFEEAIDRLGDVAWARLNLRGYVEAASASLARITGIERTMLQAVRFVTLLGTAARPIAGEAIEGVIADGAPRTLAAAPASRGRAARHSPGNDGRTIAQRRRADHRHDPRRADRSRTQCIVNTFSTTSLRLSV